MFYRFLELYNDKTVVVTGGAGFIGSAVARKLYRDTTARISVIDKFGYGSSSASLAFPCDDRRMRIYVNDLVDTHTICELINKIQPDIILHLAAESHVDRSIEEPRAFIESNVMGTFSILEAARKLADKKPVRFHHVSTDEVFGSLDDDGAFDEDSVYNPRSPYSASKAASDHLAQAWMHTYGLHVTMTNCSNNFGPFQHEDKFIPTIIQRAINNKPIPLYGTGNNVRNWIYVDEHVNGLLMVAAQAESGKTYCIGGDAEFDNKSLAKLVCRLIDDELPERAPHDRLIQLVLDRPGHDYRYSIDSTRIKNDLGWALQDSFLEKLRHTVKWYIKRWA